MDVVHRLQEVAKVATGCFDHFVVAKVAKEAHEAPAEEHHKVVNGLASDCREGGGQVGYQTVRVLLMGIEHGILATGCLQRLFPNAVTILQLNMKRTRKVIGIMMMLVTRKRGQILMA